MIALSVVMLGEAPGTARLGEWVSSVDDGMTLEDLANHIAASDAFQATYPNFSTNEEFAQAFLGNLMGSEDVPEALVAAAVDIVVGLLNDGMTRGALALAAAGAMLDIHAQGMDHPAYGDLGMVANAFANQIAVAEHYTLNARMADPSSDVLSGVTSDDATVEAAIEGLADAGTGTDGQTFALTPTIDNFTGGDNDDTFVAQPVQVADGRFNATLNSFDSIDGGGGNDTIHIFGVDPEALRLGAEDVTNVENVVITTVGDIDADLRDWTGLESVTLDRFGRDDETTVRVIVDGAMVNTDRTFNGDVTIVGANGAVNIEAGSGSDVHVGSAGHTETVMVKGGMSVRVDNGAGGGNRQSMTVTSVSVDGVARDPGGTTGATDPDETGVREATIPANNNTLTPSETVVQYVRQLAEDETPPSSDTTDDGVTPVTAREAALNTYYIADQAEDNLPEGVTLATGMILVTSDITMAEGYVEGNPGTSGAKPTLHVNSDSIETVALHNTTAIVAVVNQSKTADGDAMPEDLAVTVNGYGSFQPWGAVKQAGKLCIGGSGSAENIEITVAGASAFDLASGAVKTIDISGDSRLVLGVNNFDEDDDPSDDGVSTTLESVTVSGGAGVTMAGLSGMSSLTMIDASASSGNNRFQSKADPDGLFPDADNDELEALTMVKGGSGKDTVALATSAGGELESIDTGDGNDAVTVIGMLRSEGLTVDLGAGDDIYSGRASNSESRIDGGDGMDILHLTSTANSTYRDADNKVQSIYTGFETLNVALGSGDYDIEQLGIVNDVLATATTGAVTLENMADGMGIRVHGIQGSGRGRSTDTTANIVHESADDRRSDELDVHLLAQGRNDTRASTKGEAMLVLTTDEDIEVINISSNATAHSSRAALADNKPVRTSDYENTLTLTSTAVEELVIDGNAKLAITVMADVDGTAATRLDEVDAKDNSGGVTFAFSGTDAQIALLVQSIELDGGSGADKLTGAAGSDEISGGGGRDTLIGGAGADEISGGAGGDTLTGGADADTFEYTSASQSQVAWTATGVMYGFDTITDFASGTDDISLGRSLFNGLHSQTGASIREVTADRTAAANRAIFSYDDDAGADGTSTFATANSLREWLGNGNGVFETVTGTGLTAATTQHAITTVQETYFRALRADEDPATATGAIDRDGDGTNDAIGLLRTWVLIDVNADGDFDASVDMAIALAVDVGGSFPGTTIALGDFGI